MPKSSRIVEILGCASFRVPVPPLPSDPQQAIKQSSVQQQRSHMAHVGRTIRVLFSCFFFLFPPPPPWVCIHAPLFPLSSSLLLEMSSLL